MHVRIANAPTSWGVEDARDPANPPWSQVLDEVAFAGYRGVELGPLGFLPEDPVRLRRELDARELELVAGFVFAPLHTGEGAAEALRAGRRTCELLAQAGAHRFVIIQGFTPERERAAGRPGEAPALTDAGWETLTRAVHALARMAREEHGLLPCIHPHAGTYVEFEAEIERLLAATDPELVSVCIDTGHCAYAGVDPVALYRRHAERVTYFHFKDVRPGRLAGRTLSFEEAVGQGVFVPLGEGAVDFAALRDALDEHGFEGWATVEQDRLPSDASSPARHADASLRHLRAVGLAG
jgi:inosose dehydratase